jgi:hypothetical protein
VCNSMEICSISHEFLEVREKIKYLYAYIKFSSGIFLDGRFFLVCLSVCAKILRPRIVQSIYACKDSSVFMTFKCISHDFMMMTAWSNTKNKFFNWCACGRDNTHNDKLSETHTIYYTQFSKHNLVTMCKSIIVSAQVSRILYYVEQTFNFICWMLLIQASEQIWKKFILRNPEMFLAHKSLL